MFRLILEKKMFLWKFKEKEEASSHFDIDR